MRSTPILRLCMPDDQKWEIAESFCVRALSLIRARKEEYVCVRSLQAVVGVLAGAPTPIPNQRSWLAGQAAAIDEEIAATQEWGRVPPLGSDESL